jgi:putative oxidoreductase
VTAATARLRDASRQLRAAPDTHLARDAAVLVPRVGLAWICVYHGAATLFGAFGGAGVSRAAVFFATVAHLHPGALFAVISGSLEFFGGIAVGLGIFGRIGAAGIALDMIGAMVTVTFRNGIASSAPGGGYELTLAVACLALVVAALGTGRFGLDAVLRRVAGSEARKATPRSSNC